MRGGGGGAGEGTGERAGKQLSKTDLRNGFVKNSKKAP